MKTGRNDLCHCGSGRKYKKCCLASDERNELHARVVLNTIQKAVFWLQKNYPDDCELAYDKGFAGVLSEDDVEFIREFPSDIQQAIEQNFCEWLLADGCFLLNGKMVRTLDLLRGPKSPGLEGEARIWIEALDRHPLSLYEVQEVRPGEAILFSDLFQPDLPPVWCRESMGSRYAKRWDILGVRLIEINDEIVMSGAVYAFSRQDGLDCHQKILKELEINDINELALRDVITQLIIDEWFLAMITPCTFEMPELIDAGSGESIVLTRDVYQVSDWQALEDALDRQEDVEGDRRSGWTWVETLGDGQYRVRASLTPKGSRKLDLFCRTVTSADLAKEWLENIAGSAVQYKIREVADPRSPKLHADSRSSTPTEPKIPLEIKRQIIHQHIKKHYANWLDIALPALGGATPMEAVKNPALKHRVVELLKSIDQLEAGRVDELGGEPFDVSFLWQRLGLSRHS